MPFWWGRRRKFWYGRTRFTRRRKTYKRRYRRKPTYRRNRRFARRRRRRRKQKVRRKKPKITIQQWQPDSIVKCKIKGLSCLCAGAEGRQYFCYTNEIDNYLQPKAPGGGGFGAEMFTLEYLYLQWLARKNIWTKSNDYKDLVRYTGTVMKVFRHPTTDFILQFERQPPFLLEKDFYNDMHPYNMLLSKHHRVIPSLKTKPLGKLYVKIRIRPPKQMITKWFFQKEFAKYGLFIIKASALNLGWAYYGPNTQSRLLTFYSLNTNFYKQSDWAQPREQAWLPYPGFPTTTNKFYYDIKKPNDSITVNPTSYAESISRDKGWFQPKVLLAWKVEGSGTLQHEKPITIARYNPDIDTGQGNAVWITSIVADSHWEQPRNPDWQIVGKPLWMALYGFWNYLLKTTKDKNFLLHNMFVVKSPAIKLINATEQRVFPILDLSFIKGNLPYEEYLTDRDKQYWYPQARFQQEVINSFVESGPYIPKYSYQKESTWELKYKYTCYFKWGGPQVHDQLVQNPQTQGKYDVPDTVQQTIQVSNPLTQDCKAMLREWDYRRGIVTTTALKRMSEHLQSIESDLSDSEQPEKKKKKYAAEIPHYQEKETQIKTCLLSLFEEDTCQDPENLKQLILHQQQQQQKLKHNLLRLITDLKKKQRMLQLQTGLE
nr:MAG: ORF1 [Torque teno midi virus]